MKKPILPPFWQKLLKVIHIILTSTWTGGALSMMIILWQWKSIPEADWHGFSMALKWIDDYVVTISAESIFLTGIIYGCFTGWRFFKHRWIVAKWLITIFMILAGTFTMGPYVNQNAAMSFPLDASSREVLLQNIDHNVLLGNIQLTCFVLIGLISVFKPWKKA